MVLSQKSSNVEELEILSVVTKPGISHLIFILFLSLGPSHMLICFGSPLTVQQERNFQHRLSLMSVQGLR